MPRKQSGKSLSKISSKEGEIWDGYLFENDEAGERSTKAQKANRSKTEKSKYTSRISRMGQGEGIIDSKGSDEEQKVKPTKSRRSIIKYDRKYDGDPVDTNGNNSKRLSRSDKLSEKNETDELPKQKSWFWQRRKSGDKADEEDKDRERKKKKNNDTAASVSEVDAQSIAHQSIQTKTTQANRHTKTVEDCETEYHEAIRGHDWDFLEGLLKEYDPMTYKKLKKAPKAQPKKNIKLLKYMPDMPKIKKEKEEQETPISPLLALDAKGRTPLHLCCVEPTPTKLLLRVMNCERNAAAIKDKEGNLPLHVAIQNRRKVNVIERLVRGYYQGSWTGDGQNRTPLTIAIEVVIQKQQEDNIIPTKTYWGFPASVEDLKWQENQEKIWKVPGFLVQNRIDRRKRLLTVEHNQIFVALNKCAPPKIISNMLATGRKYLMNDEVAVKVLFLLISRQYSIFLFKWLMEVKPVTFFKNQKDFTGCGVVAAHFRVGCIKHTDQNTKRERDSFAIIMKRLSFAKKNGKDFVLPPQYTEWWEKLRFIINLWAADGDSVYCEEKLLLHSALTNPDSPPLLVQLLAKLYPKSILIRHPKSITLPIHFACRQWKFREYPSRRGEKIVNVGQICSEFLKVDLAQTRKRHRNRLPLHYAIVTGRTWDFIKPLVTHDLESLLARDPNTGLRPFQMAALKNHETFNSEIMARREYSPVVWSTMHGDEQDHQIRKLVEFYDLKQFELVYELLRHSPVAVMKMLSPKEILLPVVKKENMNAEQLIAHEDLEIITKTKLSRSLFGLGNVDGHFIGWCYECGLNGVWKPHRRNFPLIKEAIIDGFVANDMEKWWRKLNFWLWQDCPWNRIPQRADFLLHCALCNPKVSPWIVELILECFPQSATIPLPNSGGCYPLHIACVTDTYIPMAFEFSNKRSVIEMVSKVFHEAILLKWNDTLPLHYAILGSKQWSEIRSMAEDEPVSLAIPDSENDFFPFQLMALHKLYTRLEMQRFVNIAMTKIGKNLWEKTSPNERTDQLKKVLLKHELDSLGCIFELLKRNPGLVHVGTLESKNQKSHRGDDEGPSHRRTDTISIQEYLKKLESNLSSPDLKSPQDFDQESALLRRAWLV